MVRRMLPMSVHASDDPPSTINCSVRMRRLSLLVSLLAVATCRLSAQFDYGSFPTIDNIYLVGAASLAG